MVDYDSAVQAVQDPNADPVFLARIAYENPDFGANVAAHERAYPGLLRWIAEFGDDRARAEAASRGYTAAGGPVVPRAEDDADRDGAEARVEDAPHGVGQMLHAVHVESAPQAPAASVSPAASASPATSVPSIVPASQSMQPVPSHASSADALAEQVQSVAVQQPVVQQPIAVQQSVPVTAGQQPLPVMQQEPPQHAVAPLIPEDHQPTTNGQPVGESQSEAGPVAGQTVVHQPAGRHRADDEHGNPYGFTMEQALDPNTDALTIAQIAQYAPELRVYLARNPSTYPELLEWLARQHDPQIDAALAERNAVQK